MFCKNCGQEICDQAVVCPKCGVPTDARQEASQSQYARPRPSNYLIPAILMTLFCCQISGIISLVYAAQVNTKLDAGDYETAVRYSRTARNWIVGTLLVMVPIYTLYILFCFAAAFLDA